MDYFFNSGSEIIILIIAIAIFLGIGVLYLFTLYRTMELIAPENRTMNSALVWLLMIPFVSLVWSFFVVDALGQSLKNEYRSRNYPTEEEKPTYNIGLAMSICSLVTFIPLIGTIATLAVLVLWIIYWVKVHSHKKTLMDLNMEFGGDILDDGSMFKFDQCSRILK